MRASFGIARGIRTHTVLVLNQFSLPIGIQRYGGPDGIRTHYLLIDNQATMPFVF